MGEFIIVKCKKCRNEQVVFDRATTKVQCLVCKNQLLKPKGGKAEILT